jgi:branched-subunit amino acid aminotransferase/4-amino-4-deoxychorismate lyase
MMATVNGPAGRVAARYVFTSAGELTLCSTGAVSTPLVIDSWLVADGAVRALDMHERRFLDSCTRLLPHLDSENVESFLSQVRLALPSEGRWFPRIEAHAGPQVQLALWLRPAPELKRQTSLWVATEPDARRQPEVKGPDLPALAALRERASQAGADDALLSAPDGTVLEAAHSAIVWWRGETLCVPDAEGSMLPSVTRTLLLGLASGEGIPVIRERLSAVDLQAHETWTLNALHGIRPVPTWLGTGPPRSAPVEQARADVFSAALAELATPIEAFSTGEARCAPC